MHVNVRGRGQGSVGNGAVFGDIHGCGGQHRRVVAAVDGHGQRIGGCGAVTVGHREGEAVGEAFPHAQALHRGQRVIQAIGIIARGIHAERAVEARRVCLRNETHHIVQIRVRRGRQCTADRRRILNNGSCGRCYNRRVVAAVDGHGQGIGGRGSVIVGHRESEGLGQALPCSQTLYRGQRVIQGIGIIARGIHGKSAVEPGRICLRSETHHIMQIRINRGRQHTADHRRVFGDGSRGSGHSGRVVAAVDAHGDNRGGCAAVIVRDCNRKGVGEAFTRVQALYRGQ